MKNVPLSRPTAEIVHHLQQRVEQLEGSRRSHDAEPITTGCPAFDALLPSGGLQRGTLVEWFSALHSSPRPSPPVPRLSSATGTLALIAARQAMAEGGALLVMDRGCWFYPPAAAGLGIDLEQVVVVRAATPQDELWALDQALRCQGVAAVWAPLAQLGGHDFRRLQLAAESGGTIGLLLRGPQSRGQPSWAHLQLLVRPRPSSGDRRLQVEVLRSPGRAATATGQSVLLEIDQMTGALRSTTWKSSAVAPIDKRSTSAESA